MANDSSIDERQSLEPPFEAYHGKEPYIFVSYAHKDKALVYPELVRLHEAGYRIWYDEGIVPGEDFTANIANALLECCVFIVWISSNAIQSRYVKREMNMAVNREKTCLTLYLEATPLPSDWELQLSPIQAIYKYDIPDTRFWQKLQQGLPAITRAEEKLVPTPIDTRARLALTTDPPGAAVYIDEQETGLFTPCEYAVNLKRELSKTIYLEMKLPGFEDYCAEVALRRDMILPVTATLADQRGRLRITTTPPGAAVSIDGKALGKVTPLDYARELGARLTCEVEVALSLARHEPHRARVTLRRGEVLPHSIALTPVKEAPQRMAAPVSLFKSQPTRTPVKETQPGAVRMNEKDGAKMVWVPAGEFLLGSKDGEGGSNEHPQHTVYLDGYWMYQTPVTVAQYRKFCAATKRAMPSEPSWKWQDNHPMVDVTWEDAAAYAQWAGAALPSEAQWEKAARGTDGRVYPWGNDWDDNKAQCSKKEWGDAKKTAPVGSYLAGASPYRCLDMAGNVWEWCADWYDANYYRNSPSRNPTGTENGKARVLRGGCWYNYDAALFRAAYRYSDVPMLRDEYDGFRCAVRSAGP